MSSDFYIKHNMHAIEWKLNAMVNKNRNLINKFPRNWRHPLIINNVNKFNRSFKCYEIVCNSKLVSSNDISIDVKSEVRSVLSQNLEKHLKK